MRAYRLLEPGRTKIVNVSQPEPGPGQVLVKVLANGLCHSDLAIRQMSGTHLPVTMGHEVAGEVVELGPGVVGWEIGDRGISHVVRGCGTCRPCLAASPNLCRRGYRGIGVHFDGGLAEFAVIDAQFFVHIGDLDPRLAAPLADAGMTAFHTVDRASHVLGPEAIAVVIGVGGLGHMAVQILDTISATRIFAVDTDSNRLALARDLGAELTFEAGEGAAEAIRDAAGVEGVAATFDFVGADATLALAGTVTTAGGVIAVAGQGNGSIPFTASTQPSVNREVAILQTQSGSMHDLRAVVSLAQRGKIAPRTTEFTLDEVDTALAALHGGHIVGRAVIVP